jgi:tRNA(fMet)-specific endonuclease VapC
MMRYLLDTNVCIDLLRGKADGAFKRLRRLGMDEVGLSSITLAELHYGAAKSARPAHHQSLIITFCAPLAIAPFDSAAAEV